MEVMYQDLMNDFISSSEYLMGVNKAIDDKVDMDTFYTQKALEILRTGRLSRNLTNDEALLTIKIQEYELTKRDQHIKRMEKNPEQVAYENIVKELRVAFKTELKQHDIYSAENVKLLLKWVASEIVSLNTRQETIELDCGQEIQMFEHFEKELQKVAAYDIAYKNKIETKHKNKKESEASRIYRCVRDDWANRGLETKTSLEEENKKNYMRLLSMKEFDKKINIETYLGAIQFSTDMENEMVKMKRAVAVYSTGRFIYYLTQKVKDMEDYKEEASLIETMQTMGVMSPGTYPGRRTRLAISRAEITDKVYATVLKFVSQAKNTKWRIKKQEFSLYYKMFENLQDYDRMVFDMNEHHTEFNPTYYNFKKFSGAIRIAIQGKNDKDLTYKFTAQSEQEKKSYEEYMVYLASLFADVVQRKRNRDFNEQVPSSTKKIKKDTDLDEDMDDTLKKMWYTTIE